eukprot:30237-Pelagococcus_subviridis.AAC.1
MSFTHATAAATSPPVMRHVPSSLLMSNRAPVASWICATMPPPLPMILPSCPATSRTSPPPLGRRYEPPRYEPPPSSSRRPRPPAPAPPPYPSSSPSLKPRLRETPRPPRPFSRSDPRPRGGRSS